MALTVHQLALRLAKHIGVTTFDPASASATRESDLADVVACINGALQELWELAPRSVRALSPGGCPVARTVDIGAVQDPGITFALPHSWEESVLLPLALRRFSTQPNFQPQTAKPEIERQAAWALRIVLGMATERDATPVTTSFR